jgi:hypothetical protein
VQRARKLKARLETALEFGCVDEATATRLHSEAKTLYAIAQTETLQRDLKSADGGRRTPEDDDAIRRAVDGDAPSDRPASTSGEPVRFGGGLYPAIKAAGFDRRTRPVVQVPFEAARMKAATVTGNIEDSTRAIVRSPDLGYDSRFLWPLLPVENIASDVTGVQSFRQTSRSLASTSDMRRAIDSVSTKPTTSTTRRS